MLYSNTFFNNKLRTNSSFDFIYGKDQRERNPDDEQTKTASEGRDIGFTLNTNGTWNINKGWLKHYAMYCQVRIWIKTVIMKPYTVLLHLLIP